RLRHSVAARPHGTVDLRTFNCFEPRGSDCALPERCLCRRHRRDSRRGACTALFRTTAAWLFDRAKRRDLSISGAFASAHQSGCPRASVPIRHRGMNTNDPAVSIVVPVRNEAGNIALLVAEIAKALDGQWPFEVVYVDDGSTDGTTAELKQLMT